jgi:large subunit ribosomal protein L29
MNKKLEKYREMTAAEIADELRTRKEELFNLRTQHVIGQLENPMRIREVRKQIARIMTIASEKAAKGERIATGIDAPQKDVDGKKPLSKPKSISKSKSADAPQKEAKGEKVATGAAEGSDSAHIDPQKGSNGEKKTNDKEGLGNGKE